VLDRLSPANTDLQDYLSNKRKLHSEELVSISPSGRWDASWWQYILFIDAWSQSYNISSKLAIGFQLIIDPIFQEA